jgi:3-oxoacyl-[acyl-carrier protein] reductase
MDLGINGKRALVTAASRGIGRGIAINLAREGVKVAVCGRTQDDLDSLITEMGGESAGHYAVTIDLEPEGAPATLVAYLAANFGTIDIAVQNLGSTLDITDPFCEMDDWRRVFRINFEVAVELNRMLVPAMQENGWGRVVNISSIAGVENNGPITYCSAKAALTAYTRSFGRVLAESGVVMTAILPGMVKTEGGYWDEALRDRPEHVETYLQERTPSHRFGTTDEIAFPVLFACSNHMSYGQGSIIPIDGGQVRGYFS